MEALDRDGLRKFGTPMPTALRDACHSLAEWDAFSAAINSNPEAVSTQRWIRHWDRRMRIQTARRASLPPHYGNGAIEPKLNEVRTLLERRAWTFRNRSRLNMLLELVRLRINRNDDPVKWAALIRTHLDQTGGQSERSRRMADPRTFDPTSGDRIYTLRA